MRYQVRKPHTLVWTLLVTDSLSEEVQSGRIHWDWRIRRDGEPGEWTVQRLVEDQRLSEARKLGDQVTREESEESKSGHPPANASCYLLLGEEQTGPYTPEQIRSMWSNGQITAETLYWFEELSQWFPARNFCDSPVRNSPPSLQASQDNRRGLSGLLIVLGLVIAGYFFFVYDTSVETESHYVAGYGTIGGQRVHNTGLMQNRLLGCIGGLALTTIGVVLIVVPQKPSGA